MMSSCVVTITTSFYLSNVSLWSLSAVLALCLASQLAFFFVSLPANSLMVSVYDATLLSFPFSVKLSFICTVESEMVIVRTKPHSTNDFLLFFPFAAWPFAPSQGCNDTKSASFHPSEILFC